MTAASSRHLHPTEGKDSHNPRSSPGNKRRLVWIVLIAVLVLFVAALYAGVSGRSDLNRGAAELRTAETQVKAATHGSAMQTIDQARQGVTRAHDDFAAADVRLALLSPALDHLGWLPHVGPQLAAAAPAAHAASLTAEGILPLLTAVTPIAAEIDARSHAHPLQPGVLVRQLASGRPSFRRSCGLFAKAQAARASVPSATDPTVVSALHTFDRALPKLRELCAGLQVLPGLLGYPKPRTYMIAYQDPLELRATGGFIGSVGLMTVNDGTVKQKFAGTDFLDYPGTSFGAHDDLNFNPPQPDRVYNNDPVWLFRDSNWSPNFPTTAQIEQYIFKADSGRTVNGVINIVPQAAADLLGATGPIFVPEYHRWVTARNVASLSDYYTHLTVQQIRAAGGVSVYGPTTNPSADTQRKQFIGIVAHHLFKRLGQLKPSTLVRLESSLLEGFIRKDILVYFQNPAAESLVHLVGASGQISPTSSDYLYVVDSNIGFTKNNPWIGVRTHYNVAIRPNRWLDAHLTVHFHDSPAPISYKAKGWFGPCGGTCGGWDDYATFLRIYVPYGAQLVNQSGWTQPWAPGPAYGKAEFDGFLLVRRGKSAAVHLHYVIPPNVFTSSRGTRYRLVVQHQPGTHPDAVSVSVTGATNRQVTVVRPRRDWSFTAPIPAAPFHPIPLPKAPPTKVAANQWIEPHTYLTAP